MVQNKITGLLFYNRKFKNTILLLLRMYNSLIKYITFIPTTNKVPITVSIFYINVTVQLFV